MALQSLPESLQRNVKFANLSRLINQFNETPANDEIQQLFYLQAINHELHKHKFDAHLFNWVNQMDNNGWRSNLAAHGINPHASFFLTGIQFAQSIAHAYMQQDPLALTPELESRAPQLMRQRDNLFTDNNFARDQHQYIETNLQLYHLAQIDPVIQEKIQEHRTILELAQPKISRVKREINRTGVTPRDKTKLLGTEQNNNFNFLYEVDGWDKPLVFRVEDRAQLDLEQQLQTSEASRYFIDDYSVFMMQFKNDEDDIEYKPVALSQFANQGNLQEVAQRLGQPNAEGRMPSQAMIATTAMRCFEQITDFCDLLIKDGVYHPDIKLSNFLYDHNRVRVSDRKTLTNDPNPPVTKIRTSPGYAPNDFAVWLTPDGKNFRPGAGKIHIEMQPYMSFQLGMALKEFLILTQLKELPASFRDPDHDAASYFDNPSHQIQNLSLLVQELTRPEPEHRLSIKNFQGLLRNINQKPDSFYSRVEMALPSSQLGLTDEINEINSVIKDRTLNGEALASRANVIFDKVANPQPKKLTRVIQPGENTAPRETRLTRLAEKLATKCYENASRGYFVRNVVIPLEDALKAADWNKAPWYRKLGYFLTFGSYKVDKVTTVDEIDLPLDVNSEAFKRHLPALEFLPPDVLIRHLGAERAARFQDYIELKTNPPVVIDTYLTGSDDDPDQFMTDSDSDSENYDPDYMTTDVRSPSAVSESELDSAQDNPLLYKMTETLPEELFMDVDKKEPEEEQQAGFGTMVTRNDDEPQADQQAGFSTMLTRNDDEPQADQQAGFSTMVTRNDDEPQADQQPGFSTMVTRNDDEPQADQQAGFSTMVLREPGDSTTDASSHMAQSTSTMILKMDTQKTMNTMQVMKPDISNLRSRARNNQGEREAPKNFKGYKAFTDAPEFADPEQRKNIRRVTSAFLSRDPSTLFRNSIRSQREKAELSTSAQRPPAAEDSMDIVPSGIKMK